jgi:hypothetical protein
MLICGGPDARPTLVIAQAAHANLAWQLAEHWGNRRFARPAPRAEVLAAVLLHDAGWAGVDPDPGVDAEGRPRSCEQAPVAELLAIWRDSVSRAAQSCRYGGLLVAAHFAALAEVKTRDLLEGGDTQGARSAQAFRAEMLRRLAGWREALTRDARYQPFLQGAGLAVNAALVAAWDRISVHLCGGRSSPLAVEAPAASGELRTVELAAVGERRWRVQPWPLQGERLQLHCDGRKLTRARFTSAEELRGALARAPMERVTFTLERAGASAELTSGPRCIE